MKKEEKDLITKDLKQYVESKGSQTKAATSLGVSSATISQILNDKTKLVADEMWRRIKAAMNTNPAEWKIVETTDYKIMQSIMSDAQEQSLVMAVTGSAGSGKSLATKVYRGENKNVLLIRCAEHWNRKYFLSNLLKSMGHDHSGLTVAMMMEQVIERLHAMDKPLIIMDEADKLTDQVLYFFITIYNDLEDHCGILMCATNHLEKRIRKGLNINKKGYNEIYSRIGRKFITLNGVSSSDVYQLCIANGIEDKSLIKDIYKDSQYDFRRVKRRIVAAKLKANN